MLYNTPESQNAEEIKKTLQVTIIRLVFCWGSHFYYNPNIFLLTQTQFLGNATDVIRTMRQHLLAFLAGHVLDDVGVSGVGDTHAADAKEFTAGCAQGVVV